MEPLAQPEIYISADVETDGPVPGTYSMLSFGLAAIATFDGEHVSRLDARAHAAYWELAPITANFDPEALAVNGLDRDRLLRSGDAPEAAMQAAARWVEAIAGGRRPILVAYPVAFDWMFLHWYFETFVGTSPFGHSGCVDIRSLYMGVAAVPFGRSSKRHIPAGFQPHTAHTHHALEDAIEQGQLFVNIFEQAVILSRDRGGAYHK
jgi:DNA polymerase III epsilon subunit-like protein